MTTTARIPLIDRVGVNRGEALVDTEDLAFLSGRRWRLHSSGYARSGQTYMHRLIMNAPPGLEVDHKNRNGLDNRRENLRLATHAENHQNHAARGGTSRYRNVNFENGAWVVRLRINGGRHYVGRFKTEDEANIAAIAYRRQHAPFAVEAA